MKNLWKIGFSIMCLAASLIVIVGFYFGFLFVFSGFASALTKQPMPISTKASSALENFIRMSGWLGLAGLILFFVGLLLGGRRKDEKSIKYRS